MRSSYCAFSLAIYGRSALLKRWPVQIGPHSVFMTPILVLVGVPVSALIAICGFMLGP